MRALFYYEKFTLDDWRDYFAQIYGHINRVKSDEEIWFRMLEEIGELVEAARPPDIEAIKTAMPDIFAWLLAFCDVRGISLKDAVEDRFAAGCPWCHAKRNCSCIYYPDRAAIRSTEEGPLFAPRTLEDWVQRFDQLYGVTNREHQLMDIISRLVGSAGTVAKAIRNRRPKDEVEKRVANVFAWLIGVYIKYKSILGDACPRFDRMIIEKYTHCFKCHTKPCSCVAPISSVFIALVPEDIHGEEEVITNLMEQERLSFEFSHSVRENPPENYQVTVLKAAKKAHVVVLLLNHTITSHLACIFYLAFLTGKPVAIFARKVPERDPLLSQFLVEVASNNATFKEFHDNSQLRRDLKAWLRQFPRVRV